MKSKKDSSTMHKYILKSGIHGGVEINPRGGAALFDAAGTVPLEGGLE